MSLKKYKAVIHEDFSQDAELIDATIKQLGMDKDARILDIGTGFGAMAILLALNGYTVLTGQPEVDPEWDQHVGHHVEDDHEHHHRSTSFDWRKNAKAVGVEERITFQYLDASRLDLPDSSIAAVFMYDTLQHVKDRKAALNECLRVIRADGLLCVIEWNEKSIREAKEKHHFTIDYIDPEEILRPADISYEQIRGDVVNIFILRKKKLIA